MLKIDTSTSKSNSTLSLNPSWATLWLTVKKGKGFSLSIDVAIFKLGICSLLEGEGLFPIFNQPALFFNCLKNLLNSISSWQVSLHILSKWSFCVSTNPLVEFCRNCKNWPFAALQMWTICKGERSIIVMFAESTDDRTEPHEWGSN